MPQHVLLKVTPQVAHVLPGEEITLSLTIRNASAEPDRYHLHVTGLSEEWYSLPGADLTLAPGTEGCVKFALHPPRDGETLSGRYPFRVHAVSDTDAERRASAVIELVVGGPGEPFGLAVEPHEATGRAATFRVTLSNNMDFAASLALGIYCEAAGLQVSANPDGLVTVPAGGTAVVNVHVAPLARGRAVTARAYDLDIRAALPGQEGSHSPRLVQCVRFTPGPTRPWLFNWLRR